MLSSKRRLRSAVVMFGDGPRSRHWQYALVPEAFGELDTDRSSGVKPDAGNGRVDISERHDEISCRSRTKAIRGPGTERTEISKSPVLVALPIGSRTVV